MSTEILSAEGAKKLIELIKGSENNKILPNNNIVHGNNNQFSSGENCNNNLAIGSDNTIKGSNSLILGSNNIVAENADGQIVLGKFNNKDANAAIIIGNGEDEESRTNSFLVSKNGNITTSGDSINAENATLTIKELKISNKTLDSILTEKNDDTLKIANTYTDDEVAKILPKPVEEQAIDSTYILAANTDDSVKMPELDGISFREENGVVNNLVLSCSSIDNFDIQQAQLKTMVVIELKDEKENLISKSLEKILRIEISEELENIHFIISNSKNLILEDLKRIDVNKSSAEFFNSNSHWISINDQIANSGAKEEILNSAQTAADNLINNYLEELPEKLIVNNFRDSAGKTDKALSANLGYELFTAVDSIIDNRNETLEDAKRYTDNQIESFEKPILEKIEESIDSFEETLTESIITKKLTVNGPINEGQNIIGGSNNTTGSTAIRNLIVGYRNTANGNNSIIAGQQNTDNSGNNIISGIGHTIDASNVIINGESCKALSGASSSIINGYQSSAGGPYQIIVGTKCNGFNDKSSGKYQFVLGENLNAQADDAIVTQKLRIKKNGDIYQNNQQKILPPPCDQPGSILTYEPKRTLHKISDYPSLDIQGSTIKDWGDFLPLSKGDKILVPQMEEVYNGIDIEYIVTEYKRYTCLSVSYLGQIGTQYKFDQGIFISDKFYVERTTSTYCWKTKEECFELENNILNGKIKYLEGEIAMLKEEIQALSN